MAKSKPEDDIDALFRLPLAEFTSARNTLAARLKKEGRLNDAERVKLLTKPSVSAWAVNQLYWEHGDTFDELLAAGKTFRPRAASKVADMRNSLDARREVLVELSNLAETLLRDAGHNPSLDTLRRVTATLEALSAYALLPDGPTPGRLTQDVDPPSFESLVLLMSGAGATAEPAPARKPVSATKKATGEVRRLEEFRQKKIAGAKVSLQEAKQSLNDARARVQNLEVTQKKANAEMKEAEKHRREAEARLEKATAASEAAARRAKDVSEEIQAATQTMEAARRAVENATKELEALLH
jgi:DNA repair exonuclease SbcCD ATPase subunit